MKDFIGDLWTEREERGVVRLGFTRRFIEEVLGECFHVMQADSSMVRKGGPLMVIETNDGLTSLKSPLSGNILVFNAKARNFPDRLTEDDVIMQVLPEGVKLAAKEAVAKTKTGGINAWWNEAQQVNNNDFRDLFNMRVQPPPPPQTEERVRFTENAVRAAELQTQHILEERRVEERERQARIVRDRAARAARRAR